MTLLPVVGRELRVASRQRATFWMRAAAALVVMVIGTWSFLVTQDEPLQTVALTLFGIMTGSACLYCIFCGVWCTADCLSQEKRDGTLGLLFLTDLRGYDVVFGKMAATSLDAFYGVLAVVPMLGVPLLLGGVAPGEFGRMALVMLDTLFFSLTLGIGVSAVCRSPRIARFATLLLILFVAAGLPMASAWVNVAGKALWWQTPLLLPSPGYAFYAAFDLTYKTLAATYWWSLGVIHLLGWVFLAGAALIVPHSWQDKPAGAQALRWRERWQLWTFGNVAERRAFRSRLLDQNAFYWLAARSRLRPACVWAVLGVPACVWAWGLARLHHDWLNPAVYFTTALFLNGIIKSWVAAEAGRQLAEDRQQGALELLLSTPLTAKDVARGQMLALQRQFLGPILLTLSALFVFLVATLSEPMDEVERVFWAWIYIAMMFMLAADVVALHWLGLWRGLTASNPQRVVSGNVLRILVVPWISMAGGAVLLAFASAFGHHEISSLAGIVFWVVLGLATDIGFGLGARQKLLSEFRLAASERYGPRASLWKRLLDSKDAGPSKTISVRAAGP